MRKTFSVVLSNDVIDWADPCNQCHCLGAEGVREIPGTWSIRVTAEQIRFNYGGSVKEPDVPSVKYCFATPSRLAVLAKKFDAAASNEKKLDAVRDSLKAMPLKARTFQLRDPTTAPVMRRGLSKKPYRARTRPYGSGPVRERSRRYMGLAVVTIRKAK